MINLGGVQRISALVRDADGNLVSPAGATLTVTRPDGSTATPAVPLPPAQTGSVVVDFPTTQAGRHVWRLTTADPVTVHTDVFEVLDLDPGQIISLVDAKKHLNIPENVTRDDDELRGFMLATTAVVERYVGKIVRRTYTDVLDGDRQAVLLQHVPVMEIVSVTESGTAVTADGYLLDPASGVLSRTVGTWPADWVGGRGAVVVTYAAGRTAVAANISRAALIILKHMWETQRAGGGGRPGLSEEVAGPSTYIANPSSYAVPYRALELLGEPTSGIA